MLLASLRCLPYTRNKGQPLFQADSQGTCNNNVIDTKILVFYDNFIFQHPICFFRCHNISFQLLLSIYYWKVVIGGVTFHLCSPLEENTFFPPLPDTLEIPWIFFLPYWVLFHFLESLVIIQSTCYLEYRDTLWITKGLVAKTLLPCIQGFSAYVTLFECSHGFWQLV